MTPERTHIRGKRVLLEADLRKARAAERKAVAALEALHDECEHPAAFRTSHTGESCKDCPDCGACGV